MPNPGGLGPAELPDWAPLTWQVAAYVPHRTLAQDVTTNTAGEDVFRLLFDNTTRPTGDQVSRLLEDAIAYISARVRPLHPSSQSAASGLAALAAAVWVERSWPQDADSLQRANDMERQMNLMLTALVASNADANDQDAGTDDYAVDVAPVWSFDPPDPRFSSSAYF